MDFLISIVPIVRGGPFGRPVLELIDAADLLAEDRAERVGAIIRSAALQSFSPTMDDQREAADPAGTR